MTIGTLALNLFRTMGDIFTPDQEKVVKLLKHQGYSPVASCSRFLPQYDIHQYGSPFFSSVPVCYYQMLQKDGDIFVVGDIDSVYYGDGKFSGDRGRTLRMLCSCKDGKCGLEEIRDRFGETLPTRELLRQLKHGY